MAQAGLLAMAAFPLTAANAPQTTTDASRLPVRAVTVFKDGHAFVVQEGPATVDAAGDVTLDQLPTPVMGTFWAYSGDTNSRVTSVTAGQRIASVERTALSLSEMIDANPNAKVVIMETNAQRYDATIVGFLTRSTEELAATSLPGARPQLPQKSDQVILQTELGAAVVPVGRIASIIFKDPPQKKAAQDEFRNYLRVHLEGAAKAKSPAPSIGLTYLQKGIRWIPSYQVDLDGNSNAVVKLQATIVNEMIDLTNVTLNLVVGVPSFAVKDQIDPIAIQESAAQLSQYFQAHPNPNRPGWDNNGLNFANNAMTSQAVNYQINQPVPDAANSSVDLPEGAKNEDLYVFTIHNVTLKKDERLVLPISVQTIPYHDVFTLSVPVAPPSELGRNFGSPQQQEMARLLNSPKVKHKIRLANTGAQPFTTAPALLLRDGRVVSQGLMTYAAPGASADLTLTDAIDIQVKKTDSEVERVPNGLVIHDNHYFRVSLKGKLHLTNRRSQTTEIEVKRCVLGQPDTCTHDGSKELLNWLENRDTLSPDADFPVPWWNYYSFPWWWSDANGAGQFLWNVKLEKGESIDLEYTWHYFWL